MSLKFRSFPQAVMLAFFQFDAIVYETVCFFLHLLSFHVTNASR
jgi:hypothetical protein